MTVAITAIGNATPRFCQSQSKVIDFMSKILPLNKIERRLLKTIYKEAGIEFRHSVLEDFIKSTQELTFFNNDLTRDFPSTQARMKIYQENALPLALAAIEECFLDHAINKRDITHVITVSCTGMSAPGLDIQILHALELSPSVSRTTVNFMGCYGVFNAIKAAYAICKSQTDAKVLLVSVELCTIHFQKSSSLDNLISSGIFSDGAGALLIENNSQATSTFILSDFYCDILDEGRDEMTWDIGNFGFDIKLSSYVPKLIEGAIAKFVDKLLNRKEMKMKDITYFAIHPGSKKILEVCENALHITPQDNQFSYEVLRKFGNMSSATIIFVLKQLMQHMTKIDHNKRAFCCAFGPGLTLESMVLTLRYV
ncbi:MAG: type III polyketide synthase [Gammaproteobacteria bacterium]|jgi:predicted naringenin-chalcone synthase|nr:type III polyketide synthase [Gammaproteobacteria bacterium]